MNQPSNAFRPVFWATLIAGVLDISSAFVLWALRGISPIRGLQIIAKGFFGEDSFNRGLASAFLGLAAHFLIVFVAATLFYLASRRLRFLTDYAVPFGLAYGVAVYTFMTCVVLPLAGFHPQHTLLEVLRSMLIIMFLVALPIALIVRWYSRQDGADQSSIPRQNLQ